MPEPTAAIAGGSFLIAPPASIFTLELLSEEHRAVARTADEFWEGEVAPNLEAIQVQNFEVLRRTIAKSGELGLLSVLGPESAGGMEMDLVSAIIVTERMARDGSYSMCHGAQAGLGAQPILLFGTEDQRKHYLPRLASGELLAAYCLTEPQSGSDALNVKTRAHLAADGSHYVLNGQKMWITNGGIADLLTVFAKVDDPAGGAGQFTAFLVERGWEGVSAGAEEKKMGLKGSSTTAVFFDNVRVPKENLLGDVGRGHVVALNILNIGRLNVGAYAAGKCAYMLADAIGYAKQRVAFGHPISNYGLIQHKLAEMAVRTFAAESITYRVAGHIQDRLPAFDWNAPEAAKQMIGAVQEFAAECSLVKVFASEAIDFVADEAVQIHGGYGYHQDYQAERAYRDARIYRIFEGTNEINRLAALAMLLKRARSGALPLADAVKGLDPSPGSDPIANATKIALLLLGAAYEKFGSAIEQQQEVTAAITDVWIDLFTMQSVRLRASQSGRDQAADMAQVFTIAAMERIESNARQVLAACYDDTGVLKEKLTSVHALAATEPVDLIAVRRRIASRLIAAGRYIV